MAISNLTHRGGGPFALASRRHAAKLGLVLFPLAIFIYTKFYWNSGPPPPFPEEFTTPKALHCTADNTTLDWVNEATNTPRPSVPLLPIDEAKQLCAAHGLPVYAN